MQDTDILGERSTNLNDRINEMQQYRSDIDRIRELE